MKTLVGISLLSLFGFGLHTIDYSHIPERLVVGPAPPVYFYLNTGSILSRGGHVIYKGPVGTEHPFTYIGSVSVRRDELTGELIDCTDPSGCQSFTTFQIGCIRGDDGRNNFIPCQELAPRLVFKSSISGVFAASMGANGHWMIAEMKGHPTEEQLKAMPGIPGSVNSASIYWRGEDLYFARWDERENNVVYRKISLDLAENE